MIDKRDIYSTFDTILNDLDKIVPCYLNNKNRRKHSHI